MGQVRSINKSVGQRIAQSVSGALQGGYQGYQGAVDLKLRQEQAARQEQEMLARQQQLEMQRQQMQQQMFEIASTKQGQIYSGALASEDPEAYMNANKESWNRWTQFGNIKTPLEDAVVNAKSYSPLVREQQKVYNDSIGMIMTPGMDFKKKQEAYQQASESIRQMRGKISNADFLSLMDTQTAALQKVYQSASQQEAQLQAAKTRAETKPTELTPYQQDLKDFRLSRAAQQAKLDIEKNPVYKKLADQGINSEFLTQLVQEAKAGNQVAANSMGAKAARMMGEVGVLTEQDVQRYVQGGSLPRKTADKTLKLLRGTPTDMTMNEILEIQKIFQQQFEKKVQPIVDRHIDTFTKNWLGQGPKDERYREALSDAETRIGFKHSASSEASAQPNNSENAAARAWAKANPNDPRAKKILELVGN